MRRWRVTMSILARIRSGQARWGRSFLALLAVAWLNVILQPCAMAFSAKSTDCFHSPSAHAGDQMGHAAAPAHGHSMVDDHAMDLSGQPEHETGNHCWDCGGYLADCAHLETIKKSDRDRQFSPEPEIAWIVLPPTDHAQPADPRPPPASNAYDAARLTGAFPPLNVLYCVYLD